MEKEAVMIQLDDTLISLDIIEKKFVCDLCACKGVCCIDGDSGAPLETDECDIIEESYTTILPYLPEAGQKTIEEQGPYVIDSDGDFVTPLVNNQECAYTVFEDDGTAKCGIEMAWRDKKIDWQKPISCHMYPIRITPLSEYDALNYDTEHMCKAARTLGAKLGVPVYKFLKEPLERKYGKEWYKGLIFAADNYTNHL